LLRGRDLSSLFTVKVGDPAGRNPFQRIESAIRHYYEAAGFLDIKTETAPTLDREHAKVAYHLNVIPGPVYRLRKLSFRNLNAEQESKVRELLGMKEGDAFNGASVEELSKRCEREPLLKDKGIVSELAKDSVSNSVDLTVSSFN
jgi:outer membrane protein assembly factor BamA